MTERSETSLPASVRDQSARYGARLCIYLVVGLLLVTGCTTTRNPVSKGVAVDLDLIHGVSMFGPPASTPVVAYAPRDDVLALTPEIRQFIRKRIGLGSPPIQRARRLVRVMIRNDFFSEDYYTNETRTAAELFAARSGNCLSYTNLFVAMAREVGLDAKFQLARVPATWSSTSGFLVSSRHINVLIRDRHAPTAEWVTIDFNQIATSSLYPHRVVSDQYALSSFYNNIAVNYLYEGNFQASVALLAQAITVEPNNADAWVNLAAVYSRHSKIAEAKAAFEAALRADPGNGSATNGLVRLLKEEGKLDQAQLYSDALQKRREKDPYFHFAMAQATYDQNALDQSLKHINKAIELRKRAGPFYYHRALVQYAQGELPQASASLVLAQKRKGSLPQKTQQNATLLATQINAISASEEAL